MKCYSADQRRLYSGVSRSFVHFVKFWFRKSLYAFFHSIVTAFKSRLRVSLWLALLSHYNMRYVLIQIRPSPVLPRIAWSSQWATNETVWYQESATAGKIFARYRTHDSRVFLCDISISLKSLSCHVHVTCFVSIFNATYGMKSVSSRGYHDESPWEPPFHLCDESTWIFARCADRRSSFLTPSRMKRIETLFHGARNQVDLGINEMCMQTRRQTISVC